MFRKASYVDETKLRFRYNTGKKKLFSHMTNLQTYYHLQLDFQKVDQHTGGKWLIPDTKRRKDNHLRSLEPPCRIA